MSNDRSSALLLHLKCMVLPSAGRTHQCTTSIFQKIFSILKANVMITCLLVHLLGERIFY
uniref:Uncharacterized protein n=1 Tax=Rhizophora mucronata TaxID=61149 RepID=A0A2P2QHF8_RHIMU